MKKPTIIAMIPARMGSTRLKLKNLALIHGEPMIGHTIRTAKAAGCFERIVVNSDGAIFTEIAARYGVDFYQRPEMLGGATVKSDDVVKDFIGAHPCDIVAWVNPISPLQPATEMRECMDFMVGGGFDTVFTVKDEQVHCIYDGQPVNFSEEGKFAQTQDLKPVRRFTYSIMAWRTKPFMEAMAKQGHAFFNGKVGYFSVGHLSSVIIKTEQDLLLADNIARSLAALEQRLQYDPLVDKVVES